jgi:general secretion pathway protein H
MRPARVYDGGMIRTRPSSAPTSGFSLVELLVVLGILAAVMIVALPAIFTGLPGVRLRSTADELAATLRGLHELAIRRQITTEFLLDPGERLYRTSNASNPHKLPPVVTGIAFTTANILPDDPSARIRFYADGTTSGGSIRLEHEELSAWVTVEWLTGRVTRHD